MKHIKSAGSFFIIAMSLLALQSALEYALKLYENNTLYENTSAVETLRKEALNGDNSAAFLLASAYKNGKMGEIDLDEAYNWYLIAAKREDPDAMLMLGWLYYKGTKKIHVNIQEAKFWFEKAALKGVDEAAEMLELLK
jgi:hypothetical protein